MDALADEAARIVAGGLPAGGHATLRLVLHDGAGRRWTSWAVFVADDRGVVTVAEQAPVAGTYTGADAMGLFWSARLPNDTPDRSPFALAGVAPFTCELIVEVGGAEVTRTELSRGFVAPGVTREPVRERGLVGTLGMPPGVGPHCADAGRAAD